MDGLLSFPGLAPSMSSSSLNLLSSNFWGGSFFISRFVVLANYFPLCSTTCFTYLSCFSANLSMSSKAPFSPSGTSLNREFSCLETSAPCSDCCACCYLSLSRSIALVVKGLLPTSIEWLRRPIPPGAVRGGLGEPFRELNFEVIFEALNECTTVVFKWLLSTLGSLPEFSGCEASLSRAFRWFDAFL